MELLKQILADNDYTVVICGSGMMEGGGILGFRQEGRACEIEQKYSELPKELFYISCLSRRPGRFYEFYHEEILKKISNMTPPVRALARTEEGGKLQCIITIDIFDSPEQVDCRNVIYLHRSIYKNRYLHYSRLCSMEEIRDSSRISYCKDCGTIIRPDTSFYGEMVDNSIMSRTMKEIVRADVLLVLGVSLRLEVYSNYIRYFQGEKVVIIHRIPRLLGGKADMVMYDPPQNVLPFLVNGKIQEDRDRTPLSGRRWF